jgi:hypothetical protein
MAMFDEERGRPTGRHNREEDNIDFWAPISTTSLDSMRGRQRAQNHRGAVSNFQRLAAILHTLFCPNHGGVTATPIQLTNSAALPRKDRQSDVQ